jgi:hypothetical protein
VRTISVGAKKYLPSILDQFAKNTFRSVTGQPEEIARAISSGL